MGDVSDDEYALVLDEEDQRILTQNPNEYEQGVLDVEVEGTTFQRQESPEPSTSTEEIVTIASSKLQPIFIWNQRTYHPNVFSDVEFEFGKWQICQPTMKIKSKELYCPPCNSDKSLLGV